jgi:nucleoside-diphosphate-sugar epimerase
MKKISILGCGWLGLPVGIQLVNSGFLVSGSTTAPDKMKVLESKGITPFLVRIDPDLPIGNHDLFFDCEVLVICISPKLKSGGAGGYLRQMKAIANASRNHAIKKILLISSTSVYPDLNRIVLEADADPHSSMVNAENILMDETEANVTVLRFGGLVGPARHPGKFLSGKEVSGPENPVNIIHLEDCVAIIKRIITEEKWGLILNACADYHPAKKQFYERASANLGLPLPVFKNGVNSGFKIVSSEKLKRELDYNFIHPDPMKMIY